jgi:tetratricopeptide (TPR) repeat protein
MAAWVLPILPFTLLLGGSRSFDSGLSLLVASAVNLHHFILDGAIWKLRNSRIASILIRARGGGAAESPATSSALGRRLVWTAAGLAVAIQAFQIWTYEFDYKPAVERQDWTEAARALDRLSWVGHDRAMGRYGLGRQLAQTGDEDEAMVQLEKSLHLAPSWRAWEGVAMLHRKHRKWDAALTAYDEAIALAPENADLIHQAAQVLRKMKQPEKARAYLERALEIDPGHVRSLQELTTLPDRTSGRNTSRDPASGAAATEETSSGLPPALRPGPALALYSR